MTASRGDEKIEIIELEEDIRIVGLSLQKSGLPVTFASLGKLWKRYADECRTQGRGENPGPSTEYAVLLNRVPDYITGAAADQIEYDDATMADFVIPHGKYVKDWFQAERFEVLTAQMLPARDVKGWAQRNGVALDGTFSVEVYPPKRADQPLFDMYTLTPVKA